MSNISNEYSFCEDIRKNLGFSEDLVEDTSEEPKMQSVYDSVTIKVMATAIPCLAAAFAICGVVALSTGNIPLGIGLLAGGAAIAALGVIGFVGLIFRNARADKKSELDIMKENKVSQQSQGPSKEFLSWVKEENLGEWSKK